MTYSSTEVILSFTIAKMAKVLERHQNLRHMFFMRNGILKMANIAKYTQVENDWFINVQDVPNICREKKVYSTDFNTIEDHENNEL